LSLAVVAVEMVVDGELGVVKRGVTMSGEGELAPGLLVATLAITPAGVGDGYIKGHALVSLDCMQCD
jgi:hypothetical protein